MDRYELKIKLKGVVRKDPRSKKWFLKNYFREDALNNAEVQLVVDKEDKGLKIDLRCPISLKRQDIPMRTRNCTHIQTWGLESFVRVTDIENIRMLMKSHCHPMKCPLCNEVGLLVQDNYTRHLQDSASGKCVAYVSEKGEEHFEVEEDVVKIETIIIDDADDNEDSTSQNVKKRKIITGPPQSSKPTYKKRRQLSETAKENNKRKSRLNSGQPSTKRGRYVSYEIGNDDNTRQDRATGFANKRKLSVDSFVPSKKRMGNGFEKNTWTSGERQVVDTGRTNKRKLDVYTEDTYTRGNLETENVYKRRTNVTNPSLFKRYDYLQELAAYNNRIFDKYNPPADWRMGSVKPIFTARSSQARDSDFRREFTMDSAYSSGGRPAAFSEHTASTSGYTAAYQPRVNSVSWFQRRQ